MKQGIHPYCRQHPKAGLEFPAPEHEEGQTLGSNTENMNSTETGAKSLSSGGHSHILKLRMNPSDLGVTQTPETGDKLLRFGSHSHTLKLGINPSALGVTQVLCTKDPARDTRTQLHKNDMELLIKDTF